MSEYKHTPAPWRVAGRDTRNLPHSLIAADTLLARVYSKCYGDVAEEEANACLMAAAPELLAALQAVLKTIEVSEHWWMDAPDRGGFDVDVIRAAIAKATGAA